MTCCFEPLCFFKFGSKNYYSFSVKTQDLFKRFSRCEQNFLQTENFQRDDYRPLPNVQPNVQPHEPFRLEQVRYHTSNLNHYFPNVLCGKQILSRRFVPGWWQHFTGHKTMWNNSCMSAYIEFIHSRRLVLSEWSNLFSFYLQFERQLSVESHKL